MTWTNQPDARFDIFLSQPVVCWIQVLETFDGWKVTKVFLAPLRTLHAERAIAVKNQKFGFSHIFSLKGDFYVKDVTAR